MADMKTVRLNGERGRRDRHQYLPDGVFVEGMI